LKKYEGMFLFDTTVTRDWEVIETELRRIMDRAEAKIIVCSKWDERKLAYEIRGRKRGIYALVFFEADSQRIGDIERDVQLSDSIMRCLIQRVEHMTEKEMREMASRPADHSAAEADRITGRWSAVEPKAAVEAVADNDLDEKTENVDEIVAGASEDAGSIEDNEDINPED